MNIIRIKLEYGCFPIWIYNEHNEFISNDLPDSLIGNSAIDSLFVRIQKTYDSLYLNDGIEFKYIGFTNSKAKASFCEELSTAVDILSQELKGQYVVDDVSCLIQKLMV